MKWHLTEKELPPEYLPVLIYVPDRPWESSKCGNYTIKHKVAWLVKGISQKERAKLNSKDNRKYIIKGCDEYGNNLRPYAFEEFGPGYYFGQEVKAWAYIDFYKEDL